MSHSTGHDVLPPWVALVVYAAGFAITARIAFARSDDPNRDDQRLFAVALGVIWPLAVAFLVLAGLLILPTLGVKTKHDREARAHMRERERSRLAAEIARLEAENDRLRREAGEL